MGFLTFLPFILTAKGASLPLIGIALTLIFAGGAAGKLVCAFIGARIGVTATVCLTETLTAVLILAILPLPLEAAIVILPLIGIALNGTSSVLYGSVPDLVEPDKHARAFGIFYTGTIGSGAIAPLLYGLVGDAFGIDIGGHRGRGDRADHDSAGADPAAAAAALSALARQSPSTDCTSVSAATAAVSARKMRGPSARRTMLGRRSRSRALVLA